MPRFLLALMLTVLPALAQLPRGVFNWWDSPIAKDLNLSEEQRRQIRTIVREYRPKLIDQRAAVEKAEADFEDTFNEEAFDQRRAGDALERLVTARGDLMRAFSQMSLRLRALLTPEQYRELQKRRPRVLQPQELRRDLQQQRRQGRMPGGRQQPEPPPPPPQGR
jgi:Spy/CpxP family protein refolding chaperone